MEHVKNHFKVMVEISYVLYYCFKKLTIPILPNNIFYLCDYVSLSMCVFLNC